MTPFALWSWNGFFRMALVALAVSQLAGLATSARAGYPAVPTAPPADSRREIRRALREFDRFLDHHPLLEDQLRRDPSLPASPDFLEKAPELLSFLQANPDVSAGLRLYPRYFLFRALQRQASGPVSFRELGSFKDLFEQQPTLQHELNENPELVRDPQFLESHPALRAFLNQHPALAQVFLAAAASPAPH